MLASFIGLSTTRGTCPVKTTRLGKWQQKARSCGDVGPNITEVVKILKPSKSNTLFKVYFICIDDSREKVGFPCSLCSKVLSDHSSLYRHQKAHKGEKPHECAHCGKKFSQK
jgi:hypothetical protein